MYVRIRDSGRAFLSGDAYVIADSRADGHQSTKSHRGMAEVITPAAAVGYEHKWKCEM